MSSLLTTPLWRPEPLGQPIPDSPHAVSACLPTWRDNVGYEENEPRVHETLTTGYPRFVYNQFCRDLFAAARGEVAEPGEDCLVYRATAAAERVVQFLDDHAHQIVGGTGTSAGRVVELAGSGLFAVVFREHHARVAQSAWQHLGEGVSSRESEDVLAGREPADASDAIETLRRRVAELAGVTAADTWITSCGMSGFAAVHRALTRRSIGLDSVQFGFPYVDSLKVQELCGTGGVVHFAGGNDDDLDQVEQMLGGDQGGCAVFTEFPSNPLLQVPDLERLAAICRRHETPLVVDETIAGFGNVDVLSVADVICSSLTKSFSGVGDVTAGSVIINPASRFANDLAARLRDDPPPGLYPADAIVLEVNSRDYGDRFGRINENAEPLVEFLRSHPAVDRIFFPDGDQARLYDAFRRPDGGRGGLLSILLNNPADTTAPFFDRLEISKGPNLGTNYTLACPFTILAHYDELDDVERLGVSRFLVRVSVGLEPVEELIERFGEALGVAGRP